MRAHPLLDPAVQVSAESYTPRPAVAMLLVLVLVLELVFAAFGYGRA
jgi:hypothetical protein